MRACIAFVVGVVGVAGCSSSSSSKSSADNVAALVVDSGPAGGGGDVNIPYVSVELCAPGTSTCQTIDHVIVDTGSVGLHVVGSVLEDALVAALPATTAPSGGGQLSECYVYADGYVYGTVRSANLRIAGEEAKAMPFLTMGDRTDTPADCSQVGDEEDTVDTLGGNGIIGVGLFALDCGTDCVAGTDGYNPEYYSCASGTCTPIGVPTAVQLPNPVAKFAVDNNGVILDLPSIADGGAATATGSLLFGIGTRANNKLGGATVYQASGDGVGIITTDFDGTTYGESFFDSGSNDLSFPSSIAQCSDGSGFYCPSSTQHLTAMITGMNGVTGSLEFEVASADSLFANTSDYAFDNLADSGFTDGSTPVFDWGLSIFYGRRIFSAIEGTGADTPYFAF